MGVDYSFALLYRTYGGRHHEPTDHKDALKEAGQIRQGGGKAACRGGGQDSSRLLHRRRYTVPGTLDYVPPGKKDGCIPSHERYFPSPRPPLYPVIVNIHGGGLIMGSKEFNAKFCLELCRRGFVVLSLEYRLIPDVDVFQQFDDVARGMDQAIETLLMFHGDPDRVFVVGNSAGAYLATYVCAMQNAPELAKAANVQPSYLDVKALGLISGMFYTCRMDKIGLSLPTYLYGEHYKRSAFYPYTNPEHPDIIQNLPPCYLITSHDDMLQRYTLDFANALRKGNAPYSLANYPKDKRLTHAFSVFHPELDSSQEAIDGMTDYFLKR